MPKIINAPRLVQRAGTTGSCRMQSTKPTLNNKPDIVDISSKSKEKNSSLAEFFELTTTALGLTVGVKKALELPPINPDMTLADVNAHFKDIFLNENLSLGETKVMIDRYKELESIEDDEEYARAVYREAKANYGLRNTVSELKLIDEISKGNNYKIDGYADPLGCVTISMNNRTRAQLFNTIHHELRHVKQHIYAFNYAPDTYVEYSQPKNMSIPKECFEFYFGNEASLDNIPKSKHKYAKKCVEGMIGYKSASKGTKNYAVQFVEKDAFSAGDRMLEIMKSV